MVGSSLKMPFMKWPLYLKRILPLCFAAAGTLIYFSACKKEVLQPVLLSYNYFPVTKGNFVIYDVDSVVHAENDNNNDDSVYTYRFQVKEVVDSSYIDGAGKRRQILLKYRRNSSDEEWLLANVWTQLLTNSSAYRYEDNVALHKLAFPINSSIEWNGNDANTLEEEFYFYSSYHTPYSLSGFSFDSTLSVLQRDDDNYVERIYGLEIYATGVGMIYKERDDLGKRYGIVVRGLEYRMTMVDFGVE